MGRDYGRHEPSTITANESEIISALRIELNWLDVDISKAPEFEEMILPALESIFARVDALTNAEIARIDRESKPGPRKQTAR